MLPSILRLKAARGGAGPVSGKDAATATTALRTDVEPSSEPLIPPLLTTEQVEQFKDEGFLALPCPVMAISEVEQLRTVVLELFERQAGLEEGALLGAEAARLRLSKSLEIVRPVNYAPQLAHSEYHRIGLRIARQLLGPTAYQRYEHAILKPAVTGTETHWHQDEAYRRDADWDYDAIAVWMPLQPATVDNGCMRYVPGSNRAGLLRHQPVGPDHMATAIECAEPIDPDSVRACPLDAGGITIHSGRTLHSAGPNRSAGGRVAYILNFEAVPVRRSVPREVPWLDRLQGSERRRRRSWLMKGGFAIELARMAGNRQHPDLRSMLKWLRQSVLKRNAH